MVDNSGISKSENALNWAMETLHKHGYSIQSPHKIVRDMPWSRVTCFFTSKENVFLKLLAPAFAIEPRLLEFLQKQSKNTTTIIESNTALSCFLMHDAGFPLRDLLKENYQLDLVSSVLKTYATLQIDNIPKVEKLISIGAPDWRLKRFPKLFSDVISQKDLLLSDGINEDEFKSLEKLHPKILSLCEQLEDCEIPETLEHGDFHDNNILIQPNKALTINDWADANVSHPFFSLVSWLDSAMRNHQFNEQDERYVFARNSYLDYWSQYYPKIKCLKAFELATKLRPFHFVLSFSRIKHCPGIENFKQYQGYIADALRDLIKDIHY